MIYTPTCAAKAAMCIPGLAPVAYRSIPAWCAARNGVWRSTCLPANIPLLPGPQTPVLDSFAPIADLCQWLGAARMPEPVRTVCVLEMDAPIILGYPFSTCSEIYSWGDNWEIWQSSGSSAIAMRRLYGTDASAYQQSPDGTGAAVAFVVSPGSGYPAERAAFLHSEFCLLAVFVFAAAQRSGTGL